MPEPTLKRNLASGLRRNLPTALPQFLPQRRWFGGKSRPIRATEVLDVIPVSVESVQAFLVLVQVHYVAGPDENYSIPLAVGGRAMPEESPSLRLQVDSEEITLYDALSDRRFQEFLLSAVVQGLSIRGTRGDVRAAGTSALEVVSLTSLSDLAPALMRAEQSNTSVAYGRKLIFKLFRRLEHGLNPDVEIGLFLTEKTGFRNVPVLRGYLEYLENNGTRIILGILQDFVVNQGDAWQFTLGALGGYYERAQREVSAPEVPPGSLLALAGREIPREASVAIGPYMESARLLGTRTAELHLALASGTQDTAFAPEPFDEASRNELVGSAVDLLSRTLSTLRTHLDRLPQDAQSLSDELLSAESALVQRFRELNQTKLSAMRTRIHGDYHLGQVLYTGSDFVIIDFEGEPARSLEERRKKRSPLQDVAGMLRSFDYAAHAPLFTESSVPGDKTQKFQRFAAWAQFWKTWVSVAFLQAYLEKAGDAGFIPKTRDELTALLDVYILDKAMYELAYEMNNRPAWILIPLSGVVQLLRDSG